MKEKLLKNLVSELLNAKGERQMRDLLAGLLTPAELEELPRRLEIIKQLKLGLPQKQIAERLGVGIATVTRGARELKLGRFQNVKAESSWASAR